jgi:glutathione S-transferase
MRCPIERPKLPHVEAWFGRLCERPAFRTIVDIPLS